MRSEGEGKRVTKMERGIKKERKALGATGAGGGKPEVQLSLFGNLHIDHRQKVKKGRRRNRGGVPSKGWPCL